MTRDDGLRCNGRCAGWAMCIYMYIREGGEYFWNVSKSDMRGCSAGLWRAGCYYSNKADKALYTSSVVCITNNATRCTCNASTDRLHGYSAPKHSSLYVYNKPSSLIHTRYLRPSLLCIAATLYRGHRKHVPASSRGGNPAPSLSPIYTHADIST